MNPILAALKNAFLTDRQRRSAKTAFLGEPSFDPIALDPFLLIFANSALQLHRSRYYSLTSHTLYTGNQSVSPLYLGFSQFLL
ncbi:hypothetical protein GO755_38460 [Spirosoma sp. HMF4905]|uniref:Uncharacterized protein n=1 Tax=Spirosoma arboris TaxID=2682092 RepID=A0A7K1SQE2_9BACT|nr:hypothetical protein [Spirosoma arboris]MVM35960.1 hypothetical protein [Spirosoma arboris]